MRLPAGHEQMRNVIIRPLLSITRESSRDD
jgi:hypothetical protein